LKEIVGGNAMGNEQELTGLKKWVDIIRNNIFWIIAVIVGIFYFGTSYADGFFAMTIVDLVEWSPEMEFIHWLYTGTIASVLVLVVICLVSKKNRFILRSFLPAGKGKKHEVRVIEDTFQVQQNNTWKTLLLGLLIGFLTNFFCIACALIHGDISLYYEFSSEQIPILLFGFLMVLVQSGSEELWMRGFMYERLCIHYPPLIAVIANGVLFGLIHLLNPGVTVLAVLDIALCGIAYSLVKWYTGSIWIVVGIHAMWNFTQNLLFGLPNSGLVSEFSIFHLEFANGTSNLIYDYDFGIESSLPAIFTEVVLIVVVLLLAKKKGRLGELLVSYEKRATKSAASEESEL